MRSNWETSGSKPRKYYQVTPEGKAVRARLQEAWEATVKSVRRAVVEREEEGE